MTAKYPCAAASATLSKREVTIRGVGWPRDSSATIASWSGAVSVPGLRKM